MKNNKILKVCLSLSLVVACGCIFTSCKKDTSSKNTNTNVTPSDVTLKPEVTYEQDGLIMIDNCVLSGELKEEMTFNEDISSIAPEAFIRNDVIKVLNINNTSVGVSAFSQSSIKTLNVSGNNSVIEDKAFEKCTGLEDIVISGRLGFECFAGCSGLNHVVISEGVRTIYDGTFKDCGIINLVEIPPSVVNLTPDAFTNTTIKQIKGYDETIAEYVAKELNVDFVSLGNVE